MDEKVRFFKISIPLQGALAVVNEKGGYEIMTRCRILQAQLFLETTGTGAGSTNVDVKKNGATILTAPGLSIAGAAAVKRVRLNPTVGVEGEPSGVPVNPGDYIQADVTAIPATTASTNGNVILLCMAKDV